MTTTNQQQIEIYREVDREVYRSSLVSLFWAVIQARKRRRGGYKLQALADALGINKSSVSRWFSSRPNWEANSVSDIATALDIELRTVAYDRTDGSVYGPNGKIEPIATSSRIEVALNTQSGVTSTSAPGSGNFYLRAS